MVDPEVIVWADVGFIGIGVMGRPMALNLARAGVPLVVWNRTIERTAPLRDAGAMVAASPADVHERARVVILMMADSASTDLVLGRATPDFERNARGHAIINMGTVAPAYSRALATEIRAAGGDYVEAPVSGSRTPAEQGRLVAMLAGENEIIESIRPLLQPMCHEAIACGPVPNALLMKLAVNLYMISMVTGLAEAFHFAERNDLDTATLRTIVDAGPMASDISRVKASKLVTRDFGVQAAIADVLKNTRLITEAAREAGAASPLIDICHALFGDAVAMGAGGDDIAAVLRAIEARGASGGTAASRD